ncbi:SNF5-domain-containing protein [Mycena alexandri]|uniref:SNF5-domain-containing protein n=1 Tax=Mycena alexandri TaxID=1745969 RepID=A0AAD6T418_9AGAR|nr:SNF5-domain-containing protein [Mycena alexandri]
MRRAPSTPTHAEAIAAIPSLPPPAALPPPPPVPGPSLSSAPSLPPLPASVNLNPAITRVTVVPLATSLTDIPPVSADEVEAVKEWMQVDKKYEGVYREMKTRMGAELRDVMGPRSVPWWEKGALSGNASRFLQGNETFDVRYPYRKRDWERERKKPPKREGLKLPRKLDPEDANRAEELVPIRLEFDVDHHKIRDTFVWDMNACVVSPEHFAQTVVEDYNLAPLYLGVIVKSIQDQLSDYRANSAHYEGDSWNVLKSVDSQKNNTGAGKLEGESAEWWCNWRKRLRTEYGFVRKERMERRKRRKVVKDEETENEQPMAVEDFDVNEKRVHEDMRILIRLDIIVGSMKLDDQFEWDLDNEEASPENFAEIYTQELGLGGEFRTAIVHAIREQVHAYQKSLYLVGHPMDGSAVQDDDLRNSFLPSLSTGARAMEQVQAFTPLLNYLSEGELERNEKERDKEYNKRRKKNRGGRRGVPLPEREPIRTYRTPAIGFPEPDPAVLAAAAAATAPMSRRAAAAAASVTIANLVASENGDRAFISSSLPALPAPPPLILKEKTTKGFFKPPPYDTSVLRPRAKVPAPIPSSAVDVSTLPPPLEDDPPPPPTSSRAHAAPVSISDNRAPRTFNVKRGKGSERLAKEREFADGQQQNMINGVWHCSNCGCPESIAVGRRKGPLGDKSQCGTCGKYWHRYRKPRPVEYNSDYEHHATGLKREADLARRRKGRPPLSAAAPLDISEPPTPLDSGEGPSRQSPLRDVSPVSSESSASEMPLALRIKINHTTPSTPLPPPPASAPVSVAVPPTPTPAPAPKSSPVLEPASSSPPVSGFAPEASTQPSAGVAGPASPPTVTSPTNQPSALAPVPPPLWLQNAMAAMQLQPEYTNDRYEAVVKANARDWEWRLKCLDCPGKIYITGPGETLNNYELHLKNRLHRQRVNERIRNSTLS